MLNFSFLILGVLLIIFTHQTSVELRSLTPKLHPPDNLKYFALGYKETMADSLWIRLLQDFDYCGAPGLVKEQKQVASSAEPEQKKSPTVEERIHSGEDSIDALLATELTQPRCRLGWSYQMIEAITELAPDFSIVYRVGATVLSVLVDDREGAARIFEKGVKRLPKDWSLVYRASYHFLYEMRDLKKAAEYLNLAGQYGAPEWVRDLAGRIYQKIGQLAMARTVIIDLLNNLKDNPKLREKALERLRLIDEELQKSQNAESSH